MNIAVFADVHGRILLAFMLCARWEQETGQRIDLILQAGDLGVFPDSAALDKATRRFASVDPTELGFMNGFHDFKPQVAQILERTQTNLVFVRGNHEDHAWLDAREAATGDAIFPVDAYRRVWLLRTGAPYSFTAGDGIITTLGVGRIGAPAGEDDDQKPKYIQQREAERLYDLGNQPINVLLTHDARRNFMIPGAGLDEIGMLLDQERPAYHFFGHYGGPCRITTDTNGVTLSCKLADLHWDRSDRGGRVEACSMGILRWHDADDHDFIVVDELWLREYTEHTWRHL
ncbi:MAG TPA: metallophosphoesterase [Ktedonobacterales bacterium]|nr:metallophosphoesterase [Ktedonobacterales bacterium]